MLRYLVLALLTVSVLNLVDAALTVPHRHLELNPAARRILESDPALFVLVKGLLSLALVGGAALVVALARTHSWVLGVPSVRYALTALEVTALAATALYAVALINNLAVLLLKARMRL